MEVEEEEEGMGKRKRIQKIGGGERDIHGTGKMGMKEMKARKFRTREYEIKRWRREVKD